MLAFPKVMVALGTRPEAIKLAPVIETLRKNNSFEVVVCVTAQHRQMLDQALDDFSITPDIDLDLMREGQDLASITSSVLRSTTDVLVAEKPDVVLVHGDTTTAFATAMASFYLNIPLGHIEAGLRTFDVKNPFPEEFNRQVVGKIASCHFAPTESAAENLLREGISEKNIVITGNTVIDSLHLMLELLDGNLALEQSVNDVLGNLLPFDVRDQQFILITGHRRENFGHGFEQICAAVRTLSERFPKLQFVWPLHLNPRVEVPVREALDGRPNVHVIRPLNYSSFVYALRHCYMVLTDSGGIQEEAPSLGKPVVVMRDVTERPEAVSAGTAVLAGADSDVIVDVTTRLLTEVGVYSAMAATRNPFGDGQASLRIVQKLERLSEW